MADDREWLSPDILTTGPTRPLYPRNRTCGDNDLTAERSL